MHKIVPQTGIDSLRILFCLPSLLIHTHQLPEAIRVFQLNIETYPKSSNAYDSLAEGYMDAGYKPEAIANYQKAIQLNPKNQNSKTMLKKLTTP